MHSRGTDRVVRIRLTAVTGAALLVAATGTAAARSTPDVTLQGALTSERISGYGTVTPARKEGRARLTLLRLNEDVWEKVAARFVDLRGRRDSDGDGRRDSRYSGSFPSPEPGTCKLRLRVPRTARNDAVRTAYEMPCARPDFPTGTATLIAGTSRMEIDVEIARTDEHRSFGLMFKRRLGAERGMAFEFPTETSSSFWMKNTLIPLSIAFYATDGTIVRIMDMQPCAQDPCPLYDPEASYRGALEVNLGAFDNWGIAEGDHIAVVADP